MDNKKTVEINIYITNDFEDVKINLNKEKQPDTNRNIDCLGEDQDVSTNLYESRYFTTQTIY